MRKLFYLIIIMVAFTFNYVYASDVHDRIKDRCAGQWSHNQSMADICYKNQLKYMNTTVRVLSYYDHDNATKTDEIKVEVILQCFDRWYDRSYDTYNYFMINSCIRERL